MSAKDAKAIIGVLVLLVILWAVASSRAQGSEPSPRAPANSRRAHLLDTATAAPDSRTALVGSVRR